MVYGYIDMPIVYNAASVYKVDRMKILVACEFSGIVRDAFLRRGHDVISCDLLPTESPGPHYQGDVLDLIHGGGYDMMIGFPPCTYISYAGTRHWSNEGRVFKRLEALKFFAQLWTAPIDKICLENPKGCASPTIAKYSQEIQPYYFGDEEMKTTWLWLKNLPPLKYNLDDNLFGKKTASRKPEPTIIQKRRPGKYYKGGEIKKRYCIDAKSSIGAHERARFWPHVAEAMAEQWGSL